MPKWLWACLTPLAGKQGRDRLASGRPECRCNCCTEALWALLTPRAGELGSRLVQGRTML